MGALLIAALVAAIVIAMYARGLDEAQRKAFFKRLPWYVLAGAIIVLALTGRMHWLAAAFAAIVPILGRLLGLLRYIPVFAQIYKMFGGTAPAAKPKANQSDSISEVESGYFRMRLNHSNGMMSGTVLRGPHQGSTLADLTRTQLLDLYSLCRREDEESAALLGAYLDREQPEWRDSANAEPEEDTYQSNGFNSSMSRKEAAEILGVAEDADTDTIRAAHRRLMQKFHPDRDGSTFLAAKINEAKQRMMDS